MTATRVARSSLPYAAGCVAAVALLGGCSSGPHVSAQQESTQYRARAGRTYASPGSASDPWGPYIIEAAAKFDVPERWVREVMRQESGGNLYGRGGSLITSGAGAMGLMQVMPATYDEIRVRYPELGDDPYDPHNNILAGTAYIREMYDIYGSPGFLAAYNAGPGRLDDYLTRNRTLPEETRRYVAAIGPRIAGSEPRSGSPGQQYAMNAVPFTIPDGSRYSGSSRYSAPPAGPVLAAYPSDPAPIVLTPPAPTVVAGQSAPVLSQPLPAPQPASSAVPIQTAALPQPPQPASPYIVLRPQPIEVAEAPDSEPVRPRYADSAPVYTPAPVPRRRDTMQFAQLPEPPRALPASPAPYAPIPSYREPPRSAQQLAAAALVPAAPSRSAFALVTPANAEPVGMRHSGLNSGGFASGGWAVQVGAFANQGIAAAATNAARDHARDSLAGARSSVTPVRQPHGTLYRARLTGMSRDTAAQACEKLSRAHTSCLVVSPDAQS